MPRLPPIDRLTKAAKTSTWNTFTFSPAELTELRTSDLTDLIAAYTRAEVVIRDIREHLEQLAAQAPKRVCIECGRPITGRVDKVLCSGRCRMRWSRKHRPRRPTRSSPNLTLASAAEAAPVMPTVVRPRRQERSHAS